jgi:hypothetical protein
MIDRAKGWLEIKELTNKEAITPANLVEQTWLTCYPIPQILTYDRGTEFMAEFAKRLKMTMVLKEKVLLSETHKQMQSWKEYTKPLGILFGHFPKKTWMKKIRGEAFYLQQCLQLELPTTLQCKLHQRRLSLDVIPF